MCKRRPSGPKTGSYARRQIDLRWVKRSARRVAGIVRYGLDEAVGDVRRLQCRRRALDRRALADRIRA